MPLQGRRVKGIGCILIGAPPFYTSLFIFIPFLTPVYIQHDFKVRGSGEPRVVHHSVHRYFRQLVYINDRYFRRIAVISTHRIYFLQAAAPCIVSVALMVFEVFFSGYI